jgi:fatty acid desaturase
MDSTSYASAPRRRVEWPTIWLTFACTIVWMAATYAAGVYGWWPLLIVAMLCVTLHSSLQHEALHGHPTRNRLINEALVFPAFGLFFPYRRFKALHLKHHHDPKLTDPFEDPETNYFSPEEWERLPRWMQRIREANNALIGRLTFGPALGIIGFWASELRLIAAGDRRVLAGWLLHAAGLAMVLWWLIAVAGVNMWLYVALAAYPGYALLTLRTFAEHRAAPAHEHRTCIVEDTGFFGFIFLNNNLHVVHHMHPATPWYELPALYRAGKDRFLARNGGYFFASYWELIRAHGLRPKEPVPHPLMTLPERQ